MKKMVTALLLFMIAIAVTAQDKNTVTGQKEYSKVGIKTVKKLNKTSSLKLDEKRLSLLKSMELYSDPYSDQPFREYLATSDAEAEILEREEPILYAYRTAFDKVLKEVKTLRVKKGSTMIWMLYNMGFVVKTPSGCFGIDVDHRLADQLAPYLDFLLVTHNHVDHANVKLMAAMHELGKPVVSNFYKQSADYVSVVPTSYKIGQFTIHTAISDHLRSPNLPNFVTLFRVDCGDDTDSFSMLHCGDSGFVPERFKPVQGPVDLVVLRWGAPRENDILGSGEGQVQTNHAILSHLIEMRHKPYPKGQASITKTLEHLPGVQCGNTIIPFWGERLHWKNGKLK